MGRVFWGGIKTVLSGMEWTEIQGRNLFDPEIHMCRPTNAFVDCEDPAIWREFPRMVTSQVRSEFVADCIEQNFIDAILGKTITADVFFSDENTELDALFSE